MSAGPLSELPLKANDHLLDATRYALHTHFSQVRAAERTDGWLARWLPTHPASSRRRVAPGGLRLGERRSER
jgi:hypothetical protein